MGIQAPFLYDATPHSKGLQSPYRQFDTKSIYQTSSGPGAFHVGSRSVTVDPSDCYYFEPKRKIDAYFMSKSVKKFINLSRKWLFVLSACEVLGACVLFITGIIANPISSMTAWIIRLTPIFAMTHSAYAIYYLSCKQTARAIAFSAYCYFFAFLDAITIPIYIYMMLFYAARPIENRTVVSDTLNINFLICYEIGMYCADSISVLYLFSIAVSLYMARVYHKIAAMPPDMNPLEDNLTSRHKRNKSSIVTTDIAPNNNDLVMYGPKKGLKIQSPLVNRQPTGPFVKTKLEISNPIQDHLPSPKDTCQHQLRADPKNQMNYSELKRSLGITSNLQNSSDIINKSNHESNSKSNSNAWYSKDSLSRRHKYTRSVSPKKYSNQYAMLLQEKEFANEYPNFKPKTMSSSLFEPPNRFSVSSVSSDSDSAKNTDLSSIFSLDSVDLGDLSLGPSLKRTVLRPRVDSPRYGELRSGRPPVKALRNGMRQLSSGNDYMLGEWNSHSMVSLNDRGGKTKAENKGEDRLSGVRIRRFSGKLLF
ncbi:hypothetical protein OnM2_018005 [Erysiphe neolycopersici]|uniref:Uncharacterized protein n=1 Tax=Erysiphe neolycopersici TaxID=212602 RepID=A0A420I4D8_9PEZI|nr:hypothetical protein OnM2_018005 [Erysiphe neolycopersici]